MQSPFDAVFDHAEHRFLQVDELRNLEKYVTSLPGRLSTYRALRDQEVAMMQRVADRLELELPNASIDVLERSLKNGILALRYCTMGMLLENETLVRSQLLNWLTDSIAIHQSAKIDAVMFQLMLQQLQQMLTAHQVELLKPFLAIIQAILPPSVAAPIELEDEVLTAAAMF